MKLKSISFLQNIGLEPKIQRHLLTEVIQSKEKEMAAYGIRTGMIVKEALPKVPLDGQFDRALRGVIDFSRALTSPRRRAQNRGRNASAGRREVY